MSTQIRVELYRIDEFEERMKRISTQFQLEVIEALSISGKMIRADAQWLSPYKTGFLRSTIYATVKPHELTLRVGAWAHYAKFQEFGTRYIHAVRFMSRAIQGRMPQIQDIIRRTVALARMKS